MRPDNSTSDSVERYNDPRAFGLSRAAYSVNETLALLSIGRTTFYELVGRGDLKIAKLGRKSLIYAIDIAALLTRLRACHPPGANGQATKERTMTEGRRLAQGPSLRQLNITDNYQ